MVVNAIPLIVVASALDDDITRRLFAIAPPIVFEFTCDGAVALLTLMPTIVDGAGADPLFVTSMPPMLFPMIEPPLLWKSMPITVVVLDADVVDVAIVSALLTEVDPMVFPSPTLLPPTVIPCPLVSMPAKAFVEAAVGNEETDTPEIVFPLTIETGEEPVVASCIPVKDNEPVDELYAAMPEVSGPFPPM